MPEPAQIWKPMLFSFLLLSKWPFIVLSVNGEINIFQISSKKGFITMATRERLSESIPVLNEQSDIGVTTSHSTDGDNSMKKTHCT